MSRKSKRNRPDLATTPAAPPPAARTGLWMVVAFAALAVILGITLFVTGGSSQQATAAALERPELQRADAPTTGPADARVHIVEFMDPACEACASFYPFVKKLMADNPGRIRLTIRHVPFHRGADEVVKMLEAARKQDKYWQALEVLLANQDRWTIKHVAHAERALPGLEAVGADPYRIYADKDAPEVAARMKQDMDDAKALGVTKTPEYFVNGRPLPSFGYEQLAALVKEELGRAYR